VNPEVDRTASSVPDPQRIAGAPPETSQGGTTHRIDPYEVAAIVRLVEDDAPCFVAGINTADYPPRHALL
ncbi:hypothetical protein, partial [Methylopila jiangsuensis]